MGTGGKLKLEEGTAGGTHVGFKAPDTEVASELLWTLPALDGSAGQLLATDGSKNLVWVANLDSSLQSAIDSEVTARTVADSSLQANLDVEVTARTVADSSLQASVNSEVTARLTADSSLQANINASGTKVYEGTATYVDGLGTFSHGYSSLPLVMTLLVDATGGFWEQHDASAYFKISTTQVAPLGVTTLVTAFGGSTNVKLFVTKTQVQ